MILKMLNMSGYGWVGASISSGFRDNLPFFHHYWHLLYAWFPSDAQTAEPDSAGFCGDLTLGILVCQHFIVQQFSKICIARRFWILFKI